MTSGFFKLVKKTRLKVRRLVLNSGSGSYTKSNRILRTELQVHSELQALAQKLLKTAGDRQREFYSDAIVHELCDLAQIPTCAVSITDRRQTYRKNKRGVVQTKTLGYYQPRERQIVIYNKTAIQQKTVAGKTFLRCLIHEFMHHYDFYKLKINSLHTAGFYHRIKHVYDQLV